MRKIRLFCFVPLALLFLAAPAPAQTTSGYTAPAEFMDLFFDFTGSGEAGYPAGQPTLGQMLTQSVIATEFRERCVRATGVGHGLRHLRL